MQPSTLEARDIVKEYGPGRGLFGFSMNVSPGDSVALLGRNGAGKSTLMRMVVGHARPQSGALRIFGQDPYVDGKAIRQRLGVVPQDDCLDAELSVFDNLYTYGRYFGIARGPLRERIGELLDFVQLGNRRDSRVPELSGGMRRRVTLARALVNRPQLLLLDEPTTGLDPQTRDLIWRNLAQLKRDGVSVLCATHFMEEAETLCDRVVVTDEGRCLGDGTPQELREMVCPDGVWEVRCQSGDVGKLTSQLGRRGVEHVVRRGLVHVDRERGGDILTEILASGYPACSSTLVAASLEDIYLKLTGTGLRE